MRVKNKIAESRSKDRPVSGDMVLFGNYQFAHIETIIGDVMYLCLNPEISYAGFDKELFFSSSGSEWKAVNNYSYEFIGKRNKIFKLYSGDLITVKVNYWSVN